MSIIILNLLLVTFSVVHAEDDVCWWTGCQKSSWEKRGCDIYKRVQSEVRNCEDGQEYYCCPEDKSKSDQTSNTNTDEVCWWTGCQKDNWKDRGCEQYQRVQGDIRRCDNGQEYYCCTSNSNTTATESAPVCWWTGCQKNNWKDRGCEQYQRVQGDVRDCDNGQEYYCCPPTQEADQDTNPDNEAVVTPEL